ncbi:MAG: hypothetical protein RJA57_1730 [Bacteroidota bacterium]|jgi:DNA replication and repair protein RecF
MPYLRCLHLVQFKNYSDRRFRFDSPITGICGPNGTGKTNLLDAIHYLCFTRSHFNRTDAAHVQQGRSGFRIEGTWERDGETESSTCILRENGRKEITLNGTAYARFSQHIGRYPCVIVAPDDSELLTGGGSDRRNFLDTLLSQVDSEYLRHLIQYTRILDQRQSHLRALAERRGAPDELLDVLDEQLLEPGTVLYQKRHRFLETFVPVVLKRYADIASSAEPITIRYRSDLQEHPLDVLLREGRSRDLAAVRTCSGVHRDDLVIELFGQPFRSCASQGQRKSLLFALKLAEMDTLQQVKGSPPLLLLDDVFEKLDESRIRNLLRSVCIEHQGQVLITDTHPERLEGYLQSLKRPFGLIVL